VDWTSKTGQFNLEEMERIERMSVEELLTAIGASYPVVALRALVELLLNGDTIRLEELLADEAVATKWRAYETDSSVTEYDHEYAEMLKRYSSSGR